MRIIQINLNNTGHYSRPMAACIGYFDGLHLGHQELIKRTNELAKKYDAESALITFDPDPWVTIKGLDKVEHLSSMRQRINLAVKAGIKNIIILNFTKDMASLSPEDFEKKVLGLLNLKALVCGFDFHYGFKGEGNPALLKEHVEYEVDIIESVNEEDQKISSSRICELIHEGNIPHANKLLGYRYQIEGKIVYGKQEGNKIGFPTANIKPNEEYVLPKVGVYACFIYVKNIRYKAMVNLGHNPTFNYTKNLSIEAHIMDFNHDIYGQNVLLEFVKFIRPEMKFMNKANLILQLEQDTYSVKKVLANEQ